MRNILRLMLAAIALLSIGCGNSTDDFVVINGGAGAPAQLAFVTNPAQTTNTDFSVAPIVEVQDASGNRVPGATTQITVSLVNPGSAVLNGTTTRNAVDGRAVFTGLSVSEPGTFTLQASASGLSSGTSSNFVVNPRLALYGVASASGVAEPERLIELDPNTGLLLGVLGDIGDRSTFAFINDIECLPNGTILGTAFEVGNGDDALLLINVNPANPEASTVIGTIDDGSTYDRIFSLAYDSGNQILYALLRETGGNVIVATMNPTTGAVTPLPNPTGENGNGGNGLAFDENSGTLFRTRSTSLYSINTTTGIGTLVGAGNGVTFDGSGPRGLDFHPSSGTLYAASRGTSGTSGILGRFGTINTTTGVSSVIGSGVGISGLSFCEDSLVGIPGPVRQTGYTLESIPQSFVDISSTGMALSLNDDDNAAVPIGFTFNFNGTNYTQANVSSNGYLSFGNLDNSTGASYLLPGPDLADSPNSLALWFDDLDPEVGGEIYTETRGTAPNRSFVVHYDQVEHHEDVGNGIEAEIILYEGTNIIEYHYSDVVFGDLDLDAGQSAAVGIQIDENTADMWSALAPVLTATTAIRFTPPSP